MSTGSAGLSDKLATHIATMQFEQLPAATVTAAKRALLDGVGVMLAASGLSADVAPFVQLARAPGSAGTATMLGTGLRASAPLAALANGAMAHALDYEDAFDAAPVHPNASLLPALLSLAQTSPTPVSGREFLTALAVGCDLACRLALCLRRPMEDGGWYPPPIIAAYGAVAGAARLLRLDARQVRDAWSLMLCQATCPGEIKYSADSVIRAIRESFPAQAAVLAASLAAAGVRGFEQPFEGPGGFFRLYVASDFSPEVLLQNLGSHFHIDELSFKPWPCCRGTHAYIELAQSIRQQHRICPQNVARIVITGGIVQRMLCEPQQQKRQPRTVIDAKFSLPFTIAAALTHTEITFTSFTPEALADEALLALARRCDFVESPGWGRDRAAAGELAIRLNDGSEFRADVAQALGHPTRPLSDKQLRAKFLDCAAHAQVPLEAAGAAALADRLLHFEEAADAGATLRCEAP